MPAGPHSVDKALLDGMVEHICRLGLRAPAMVVLDAGKPLALIFAQLLWIAEPTVSVLYSGNQLRKWAGLLEQPETVALLMARLEEEAGSESR